MLETPGNAAGARHRPALRRNFRRLLAPARMAFIGGTQVERTLTTLRGRDFAGVVDVVHPKRSEIAGYRCVPTIADLPAPADAVFLAVNADATIRALDELRRMDAGGAVCYASGFAEIGAAGAERNRAFIAASGDMAVVGPNCYGLVNYVNHGSIWPSPFPVLTGSRGAARAEVEAAIRGLKCFPLIDGFRGRPAADLAPIVDAVMAIAGYAADPLDTLAELDVNPLMVGETGAVAVDALIVEAARPG